MSNWGEGKGRHTMVPPDNVRRCARRLDVGRVPEQGGALRQAQSVAPSEVAVDDAVSPRLSPCSLRSCPVPVVGCTGGGMYYSCSRNYVFLGTNTRHYYYRMIYWRDLSRGEG